MAALPWLCYLAALLLLLAGQKPGEANPVSLNDTVYNISHHHHAKNETKVCTDGRNNYVLAESSKGSAHKEMLVKDLSAVLYYGDGQKPACHEGRPTVLLPGVAKFLRGTLVVPSTPPFDVVKSGIMRVTVKSPSFNEPLCLRGESQYLLLPNTFCSFNLCELIGVDICEVLQRPGVHTLKELEEKVGFNRTLTLPEPPSLLGVSLLDLFSGEFWFEFSLESEGRIILEVDIPSNDNYLQLGLYPATTKDDDDN